MICKILFKLISIQVLPANIKKKIKCVRLTYKQLMKELKAVDLVGKNVLIVVRL